MKEQPALDLTGRRTSGVVVTVEDLKELLTGEQAIITVSCLMKDIKRARNALQQAGLIDFQSRQGRRSTLYKVIPLTAQKTPQTAPQTAPIPRLEEGGDEGQEAARNGPNKGSTS